MVQGIGITGIVRFVSLIENPAKEDSVAIDITMEDLIRLNEVPKLKFMPPGKDGKRIALSTVYRWTMGGTGGVKLETLKVGGTLCTSVEALQRFFNGLSKSDNTRFEEASSRSRQFEANEEMLNKAIYGPSGKPGKMDAEMKAAMKDPKLSHLSPEHRRRHLEADRRLRDAGF
jgi:hypothetical protein